MMVVHGSKILKLTGLPLDTKNRKGKITMQTQLQSRLSHLKSEFEAGQKQLSDLEAKAANLRNTLLRISAAIQDLEEELSKKDNTEEKQDEMAPVT